MQSTFAGIELGKRSLTAFTQGLQTTGHNMGNASVAGYSRQRVEMRALAALNFPSMDREESPGQLGQGVGVARIERIRDVLLEGRILEESSVQGYWSQRDKYILMLEQVYNEPTDLSVRSQMDRFWESWQELSMHPSEIGSRKAVLQRGATLLDAIHGMHDRLAGVRTMIEDDIRGTVSRVNTLTAEIASLNEEIVKIKAVGDNPNDLLDRRDLLVSELSSLIEVTVASTDPDEFIVYSRGMHIVQGKHFEQLQTVENPHDEGYSTILWENTDREARFGSGKLGALVELRDGETKTEIQKLDLMTVNFVDLVNEIHREGTSLSNERGIDFFIVYPFVNNVEGNYDRDGDGVADSTYVFRMSGANRLSARDQIGLAGTLTLSGYEGNVSVEYYPADTVEDVIKRVNLSGSEVVARLDYAGRFSLKGVPSSADTNPDFVVRHLEDSGQFLVGYAGMLQESGPAGAYDWGEPNAARVLREDADFAIAPLSHPARWIEVNQALFSNPGSVVSSFEPGDGAAALAIAQLRTSNVMVGLVSSFDDFFAEAVAEIGLKGEQASIALEAQDLVVKELENLQQSVSGVNMDEEVANLVKYQHAYSAAARFISEIDKMLDTIINRMGV